MLDHHIALYRKYRPQSFSDVVGQEHVVTVLSSAVKHGTVSHAYLFCGSRGTGKTTVARIFAHDIGCNPEDIIEIDAASNRGIDEIRELRDAVRTAPFSSPYKVYIIDEAHMLTKEAANAFLKTLEEPPSHVVFILATTDPEKLPATIVSRLQKLLFVAPDIATLAKRLVYVAHKEGKDIDMNVAELIASHGKGSYRDALGVLEQVLTSSGTAITYEHTLTFLGVTDKAVLVTLARGICTKDSSLLLESFASLQKKDLSPLQAYDDLVELFRVGLLFRIGEKEIFQKDSSLPLDTIESLAKEYPHSISSKTILTLLSSRHLVEVSAVSAWTAFQSIVISFTEEV